MIIERAEALKILENKARICRNVIIKELLDNLGNNDDKVREAIGSVAFRKLEELDSYEKQANAYIEEWIAQ